MTGDSAQKPVKHKIIARKSKTLAPKLFTGACEFVTSAFDLDGAPTGELPEIAFWGRSNCGKSSLLNSLVRQKQMARTSRTPGRTQSLNFFCLDSKIMLVDMPGYGFTQSGKLHQKFTQLNQDYIAERRQLRFICLLIDMRRGIMPNDQAVIEHLTQCGIPILFALTKQDAVPKKDHPAILNHITEIASNLPTAHADIFPTSVTKNLGILALQKKIALLL